MIKRSEIRALAEAFWQRAGGRASFGSPIDIERAVLKGLPLVIKRIPGLTSEDVRDAVTHLSPRSASDYVIGRRLLHGCLFADLDVGILFVDANDDENEQRVTIAHESAHFVLHYLEPRRRAVSTFGAAIVAVLDRTRPPTRGERLSSALREVPLVPWAHSLVRNDEALVSTTEAEADDLAIEFLAPIQELRRLKPCSASDIGLAFGLPNVVAERVFRLLRLPAGAPGVVHLLKKR